MQRTELKTTSVPVSLGSKSVVVYIKSSMTTLEGNWHWELQSEALYCSDVISFPADFEGTKAIIHPDEIDYVHKFLMQLQEEEMLDVSFRIFTTYGEVKEITGESIYIQKPKWDIVQEPKPESWQVATQLFTYRKEIKELQQIKLIDEFVERVHEIGTWWINKSTGEVYYSDNVFRLYGLPVQSLNAHPNTFHHFIHSEDRATVVEILEKAYATELPVHIEYRIVKPDGSLRWLRLTTQWSFNNEGQHLLLGVIKDITIQIELEMQMQTGQNYLLEQERRMQFMERSAGIGIWKMNVITRKVTFSDHCHQILGVKSPDVLNGFSQFLECIHPTDQLRVKESLEKLYLGQAIPELEFRIIRRDGHIRHIRQSVKLLSQSDTQDMVIGVIVDITAQKEQGQKIAASNKELVWQKALYRLSEETTQLGYMVWHPGEENMSWSEGLYNLLGLRPNSVNPSLKVIQKSIHPDDVQNFTNSIKMALLGQVQSHLLFRVISKGSIRHLKLSFHNITVSKENVMIGLVQDVTEIFSMQRQLMQEKELKQFIYDSVNEWVILTDINNTVQQWNHSAEIATGIQQKDALYLNIFDLFPALKQPQCVDALQAVEKGDPISITTANVFLNRPHLYTLKPYLNAGGEVVGILYLVRDISKEKELEERLHERLNFIETLVESSVDRIVVLDRNMNYLYWNKRAEDYYGIPKSEILGRNILELFPGIYNEYTYQEFRKALQGETVHIPASQNLKAKKGYFETYLIPIKNQENAVTAILWVVHDLLNEFLAQQQQQKSSELLNMIGASLIEVDYEYRIIFLNPTAETFLNTSSQAVLGKLLWEVYPLAEDPIGHEAIIKAQTEERKVEVEYFSTVYQKWIFLSICPTGNGLVLLQYDRQQERNGEE